MKLIQLMSKVILLVACLVFSSKTTAQTISNLQRDCPYDTTRLPCTYTGSITGGCAIPNYLMKHQQDCCGSIRLCRDTNTVYNQGGSATPGRISTAICGAGCKPGEINSSNTCLSSSEKNTSWYTFEVRPLPNGGRRIGDFAGYLRMKIIPCDVPPNPSSCTTTCDCDAVSSTVPDVFNDAGTNAIGATDYDWVLYEVTQFPRSKDLEWACPLINQAPNITGARPANLPWVRRCNYTGTSGPTGMYDPGRTPGQGDSTRGGGGNRYVEPMAVYVGQRFVLAVDNFSGNVKGYKIDFTGRGNRFQLPPRFGIPDQWPTATVVPPSGNIQLDTAIEVTSCIENTIKVRFNRPVPYDSIVPSRFQILNPNVPPVFILSIAPDPSDTVLGFARKYTFTVNRLYSSPTYKLVQLLGISDPCGNQEFLDTTDFVVNPFTYFDTVNQACQNAYFPPKHGNKIHTYTLKSKISATVPAQTVYYRYQYKIFTGMSGTDSVFVPIPPTGNDSIQIVGPDVENKIGPTLVYTPTASNATYRVPIRLIARLTNAACEDSARASIIVNYLKDLAPPTVNVCFGDPINIALSPADTVGRNFVWRSKVRPARWVKYKGNISYMGDTVAYDTLQIETIDRVTGCNWFSSPFAVQTAQNHVMSFDVDTVSVIGNTFPMTVRLKNTTRRTDTAGVLIPMNHKGISLIWNMGNGDRVTVPSDSVATYTYQSPGPGIDGRYYGLTMQLYDTLAYRVTPPCIRPLLEQTLLIYNPLTPNVITPGGDGNNEALIINGISKEALLTVYNRYGVKVYEQANYRNDFKAEGLPAGTYYYYIEDKLAGNTQKGWVQVFK